MVGSAVGTVAERGSSVSLGGDIFTAEQLDGPHTAAGQLPDHPFHQVARQPLAGEFLPDPGGGQQHRIRGDRRGGEGRRSGHRRGRGEQRESDRFVVDGDDLSGRPPGQHHPGQPDLLLELRLTEPAARRAPLRRPVPRSRTPGIAPGAVRWSSSTTAPTLASLRSLLLGPPPVRALVAGPGHRAACGSGRATSPIRIGAFPRPTASRLAPARADPEAAGPAVTMTPPLDAEFRRTSGGPIPGGICPARDLRGVR